MKEFLATRTNRTKPLKIGDKIIVKPVNKLKKKHRDRVGIIVELEDHLLPQWANVKFDDTKRIGKVETMDIELVPK